MRMARLDMESDEFDSATLSELTEYLLEEEAQIEREIKQQKLSLELRAAMEVQPTGIHWFNAMWVSGLLQFNNIEWDLSEGSVLRQIINQHAAMPLVRNVAYSHFCPIVLFQEDADFRKRTEWIPVGQYYLNTRVVNTINELETGECLEWYTETSAGIFLVKVCVVGLKAVRYLPKEATLHFIAPTLEYAVELLVNLQNKRLRKTLSKQRTLDPVDLYAPTAATFDEFILACGLK